MPAARQVEVSCTAHRSAHACYRDLKDRQSLALSSSRRKRSAHEVRFLEGLGFSNSSFVTVSGRFPTSLSPDSEIVSTSSSRWGSKWFFNIVRDRCRPLFARLDQGGFGKREEVSFVMDTKDYLFRHDHGSFWMASYRIPQTIGRFMGSLLDSSAMFKLATALPWAFPKSQIVLQDFMLPFHTAPSFLMGMQKILSYGGEEEQSGELQASETSGIWPVWLLPMRGCDDILDAKKKKKGAKSNHRSIFSLRDPDPLRKDPLTSPHYCNAGAYGIPKVRGWRRSYSFVPCNKRLEALLHKCGGRKVLYSHAFYDRKFFYEELYDGKEYFRLRKKYCADNALPEIYDKVITKNGKL